MKIIAFKGGLGNQMFQYVFYNYLLSNCKDDIVGFYGKKELGDHNGFELKKCFQDISLPPKSLKSNFIINLFKLKNRLLNKGEMIESSNMQNKVFYGYWHDLDFFTPATLDLFNFNVSLNDENKLVLNKIKNSQSVSIHIRRGDYIGLNSIYGDICTIQYYKDSIEMIKQKVENPIFIFFSDDMAWVKENFNIPDAEYIDWNTKENAYIDMFLMSNCKHNIIANSTFSWWGAYLNRNSDKIVIAPSKWINLPNQKLNIFPKNWIKL